MADCEMKERSTFWVAGQALLSARRFYDEGESESTYLPVRTGLNLPSAVARQRAWSRTRGVDYDQYLPGIGIQ